MAATKLSDHPKKDTKKAIAAPSKKTMNFVHHESSFNVKKLIPVIAVIIAVAAVGAKFGFMDQLDKKTQAYNALSEKQSVLSAMETKLSSYNELADQYGRYSYGWMSEDETAIVDRIQIMELLDKEVRSVAGVKSIAVNKNVATLSLFGITLEQASAIVADLEDSEIVDSASVYNVKTVEEKLAEITMGVVFAKEVPEE